jgi:hypothetical protein
MPVLDLEKRKGLPSKLALIFQRESVKMAVSRLYYMNKELASTLYKLTKTMAVSDLEKNEALPPKPGLIFPTETVKIAVSYQA